MTVACVVPHKWRVGINGQFSEWRQVSSGGGSVSSRLDMPGCLDSRAARERPAKAIHGGSVIALTQMKNGCRKGQRKLPASPAHGGGLVSLFRSSRTLRELFCRAVLHHSQSSAETQGVLDPCRMRECSRGAEPALAGFL